MALEDRLLQRLKLRDLRVLISVVNLGSMGKAARALAISQPAVSSAVADMERTLGVRLLDRTPQGAVTTPYGAILVKWGFGIFNDLRQAAREMEVAGDATAGEIRIGSTEPMTAGLVAAVLDRLTRQHPRLTVHVAQAPTLSAQYRDLRERNVDLILGRIVTDEADDDLQKEVLFDDPLFVVCGTGSKWIKQRKIPPAALLEEPWALSPYGSTFAGSRAAEAFRACGLTPPRLTVSSSSIQLFTALMATGRFLSVISGSTLRFSGKRLGIDIVPVALPIRSGPVGILTLQNRTLSSAAQRFIDCARAVTKPLSETNAWSSPSVRIARSRARPK
jgi:DNA-binding transcriptional LysR family regulator